MICLVGMMTWKNSDETCNDTSISIQLQWNFFSDFQLGHYTNFNKKTADEMDSL